jgi:hypothetical protein
MTKDEALRLALEALELHGKQYPHMVKGYCIDAITAIKEALAQPWEKFCDSNCVWTDHHPDCKLAQPEPNYKKVLEVWLDKTEWVQETVKPHELGMHRADVLKQRIQDALAQPKQHQDWCASLTQMLMSMPPKPAPCNCKPPQRTWVGLTDEDRFELAKAQYGWEDLLFAAEAKLKEKNS